ncbi:glycosyltransferase family 2 protein [Cohnella zeiphila]|uniref:Glycosyltransferase family 2 protein n=1 Tax=Cohnella zeiphila TaxID=2761120 RepID=A0A7X0SLN3_9BACL|nr:glycosyltransferase family 2 protein [Cohnella zeiphila]MBB6732287.1 glycosyltransferase family 2 protein [Cohnella zeiphila]
MSTVSVCIVTYNSIGDIMACLEAVVGQTHPVEQIIVVDNASSDGSAAQVRQWSDRVHLEANTVNVGFAGGQNQAIAKSNSDYVLALNPDVVLDPHYLSEILAVMDRDPSIGSATGQLVLSDNPAVMDSAGLAFKRNRQAYDLAAGEPVAAWGTSLDVFGVSGAAAVYRAAMVRDISYNGQFFDETFFAYKEDVDVAWRARRLQWTAKYVPNARAVHRRGWKKGGRKALPLFVRRHSYQNRFFTLIKNEPAGWHWFGLLPLLIVTEGLKLGYIALFEPGLLACWPTIWKKWPEMLEKRRWLKKRIQAANDRHR